MTTISKPSVYLETTIISYFCSRPTRDKTASHYRAMTLAWWQRELPHFTPFISPFVLNEISRGDQQAAQKRILAVSPFPILEYTDEVDPLAEEYLRELKIPDKARADAYHLAISVVHKMDFVLSLNFSHFCNGWVRKTLERINLRHGIITPAICSPEELRGGRHE